MQKAWVQTKGISIVSSKCIDYRTAGCVGEAPRPTLTAYQSIQGWCDDIEAEALQELARDKLVLEIGSWNGRSAIAMAATAERVIAIDHFYGDDFAGPGNPGTRCWQHIVSTESRERVSLVCADWRSFIGLLDIGRFGMVYYDADHTYEATREFIDRIAKRISVPVAIHDYDNNPNHAGVKKAVDESLVVNRVVGRLVITGET